MNLDRIRRIFQDAAGTAPPKQAAAKPSSDDGVPADIGTILAATEKLLAVNRGLTEPDERDSMEFRRVYTPDKLFAERIELDADKIMRSTMRRVSKHKNLKPIGVGHFDSYMEGMIVGNPLSSPIEEINPAAIMEQARRITQMGPGGLPSRDSITTDSQNVHPSQFGFISSLEGPESELAGIDTRMAWNVRVGSDGNLYQRMFNRRRNKHQWVSASDLATKTVGLPD